MKTGFTLIELLIVVFIISILIAVGVGAVDVQEPQKVELNFEFN